MNLFRVLINPRLEELEFPERLEVASAANLLDVGEFQVLENAYREWYGHDMPPVVVNEVFRSYMYRSIVPPWARHYARRIIEDGGIPGAPAQPSVCTYGEARRELGGTLAFAAIIGMAFGAFLSLSAGERTTAVLPPAFTADELGR